MHFDTVGDHRVAQIARFCGGGSSTLHPGDEVAVLIKRKPERSSQVSLRSPDTAQKPCRFFKQQGSCRLGDRCKFAHGDAIHASESSSVLGARFVFSVGGGGTPMLKSDAQALFLRVPPSTWWGNLADLDACAAPLSVAPLLLSLTTPRLSRPIYHAAVSNARCRVCCRGATPL